MKSAMFASALVVTSADWKEFKSKYGKVYNGLDHEAEHRQVYEATMAANAAHNALNLSWTQGENQFSDLTQQQYRVAAGLDHEAPENRMGSSPYLGEHVHDGSELPASVNWVTAGAVTPVKDQGACGSCWIFSTTGSTEGAWQIATGSLQSLSEQQFLDCLPDWPMDLCKGGMKEWAIDWATSTDLATEGSYPSYKAYRQEHCQSSFTTAIPQGSITGYKSVEPGSIDGLQSAIQQQPVSITIEAENDAFRSYSSGILSSCGGERRHAVLAVGYGTESGQAYWLVKNSWGTSWGDNGFVKILLWACGVLSEPLYPQVSTLITV